MRAAAGRSAKATFGMAFRPTCAARRPLAPACPSASMPAELRCERRKVALPPLSGDQCSQVAPALPLGFDGQSSTFRPARLMVRSKKILQNVDNVAKASKGMGCC